MAENTAIGWTDKTFNHVRGCVKVSEGCKHCYADAFSHRNPKMLGVFGTEASGGTRVVAAEKYWKEPLKWNLDAAQSIDAPLESLRECIQQTPPTEVMNPRRTRVFCASLADVFEQWSGPMMNHKGDQLYKSLDGWTTIARDKPLVDPGELVLPDGFVEFIAEHPELMVMDEEFALIEPLTMDDVRDRLFKLIDSTPNLDWQLLTKRPENIRKMWVDDKIPWRATGEWHRDNVWLGCTVENQQRADERIPHLIQCSDLAPVLFLSCEPLLGQIDLEWPEAINPARMCCSSFDCGCMGQPTEPPLLYFIHQVIVGCESGPSRRHTDLAWVRSVRDQCARLNTPFFVKQLEIDGKVTTDMSQFPEDLRIQEFPQ